MTEPTTEVRDPLGALLDRRGAMWRTFAVPSVKVMFVQVHKNACTSLKWMLADIAGEEPGTFTQSLLPSTVDEDDVHDRKRWTRSPRLNRLEPELRAQIHPDNGWFVFAVTRDPRARLFSAWQSKLLLENPGYTGYRRQPWYPRHPVTTDSVVADFATFVEMLEQAPAPRILLDPHFQAQVELLHEDVITYTDIYDVREMSRLLRDLRHHLDQVGWTGELELPRANDTPLKPNAQPFVDGVRERVERLFAADFERFGDRWDFATLEAVPAWTDADLREAERRAVQGRRLGYYRDQAIRFRNEAAAAEKLADQERARADKAVRRAERLQRVTARPTAQPPTRVRSWVRTARQRIRKIVGSK